MSDINNNEGKLLSFDEASKYLGLETHALKHQFYGLGNKTQPVPTKLGARVYFTTKSLDNFIAKHTADGDLNA